MERGSGSPLKVKSANIRYNTILPVYILSLGHCQVEVYFPSWGLSVNCIRVNSQVDKNVVCSVPSVLTVSVSVIRDLFTFFPESSGRRLGVQHTTRD